MNPHIPSWRRTVSRTAVAAVAAVAGLLGSAVAAGAEPTPPRLPRPCGWVPQTLPRPAGSESAEILGGDAAGTVWAGEATDPDQQQHAVLWRNGQPAGLGGTGESLAVDVNRNGVAVGQRLGQNGLFTPMLWRDGQAISLAVPSGSSGGRATGINDAGLIVGEVDFGEDPHAAAWSADHPEQVTDLGTAGGVIATLHGVSEAGVLAGETTSTTAQRALTGTVSGGLRALPGVGSGADTVALAAAGRFIVGFQSSAQGGPVLWDNGTPTLLSHDDSTATAVNPSGLVVESTEQGGAVWQGGRRTVLQDRAGTVGVTVAAAVSDDGRVAGSSFSPEEGALVPTIWTCGVVEPRHH